MLLMTLHMLYRAQHYLITIVRKVALFVTEYFIKNSLPVRSTLDALVLATFIDTFIFITVMNLIAVWILSMQPVRICPSVRTLLNVVIIKPVIVFPEKKLSVFLTVLLDINITLILINAKKLEQWMKEIILMHVFRVGTIGRHYGVRGVMKSIIKILLIMLITSSSAYAQTIINISGGACGRAVVSTTVWINSTGMYCTAAMGQCPGVTNQAVFGSPVFPKLNNNTTWSSSCLNSCTMIADECDLWNIFPNEYPKAPVTSKVKLICDASLCDGIDSYEETIVNKGTVANVPLGGEKEAADSFMNSTVASQPYNTPATGFVRTDGIMGNGWIASMSAGTNTVDLIVTAWKRGGYQIQGGDVIPLAALAGGGTGGGGWGTGSGGTGGGVGGGTDSGVSSLSSPKGTAADPLNVAIQQPKNNPDTRQMDRTGQAQSGDNIWDMAPGVASVSDSVNNMKTSFSTFVTNMKGTSLFSLHSSYFTASNAIGSTAGTTVIKGGATFGGDHEFKYDFYAPFLLILKSVVMVIFAFLSVRVVVLKGGS